MLSKFINVTGNALISLCLMWYLIECMIMFINLLYQHFNLMSVLTAVDIVLINKLFENAL